MPSVRLLPHASTIVSTVDWIHRQVDYRGGRLALGALIRSAPGFLVAVVPAHRLPPGSHAVMRRSGGVVQILVNEASPRDHQRHSIAHEVGHAVLHSGLLPRARLPAKGRTPEVEEAQADYFATTLLAPLWAVEKHIPVRLRQSTAQVSDQFVRRVAGAFEVPEALARAQLDTYAATRLMPLVRI